MNNITRGGKAALLTAHCAGMVDMVSLPIWMGTLIGWYGLDPQRAGLLVSLFLAGQVVSSLILAPMFTRVPTRTVAVAGFAIAMLSFLGVSQSGHYPSMLALHFVGGLGAGCALSVTHGTVGRSANPHSLFAAASFALATFGLFVLGGGTKLVAERGGAALFVLFAAVMLIALLVVAVAFPRIATDAQAQPIVPAALPRQVWFGMAGMSLFAVGQSAIFSFVERIGMDRGYGADTVSVALVAVGLIALLAAPLAGWLQHRLRAEAVVVAGPLLHAAITLLLVRFIGLGPYVVMTSLLLAATLFIHIFLFGLLTQLDPTGRAVAATPAMLMIGAAIGPVLGGSAVKLAGYTALSVMVACIGLGAAILFLGARRRVILDGALPA